MNKKLAAALSGGAALVLALTGCNDESEKSDKVNDWAKTFCDAAQPHLKSIQSANAAIQDAEDEPDAKKLQQTDSMAFQKISDAYTALGKAVNKAGAPPVDDGEKTKEAAVKELNETAKAYQNLKTTVDKLDAADKAKFAEGLNGIAKELKTISQSGDEALQKLQEGEIGQAMTKQTGCQRSTPTPAPAGS
ncbi:small secreted protein [Streptomyces sp. SAJ15]|uniref:small secreted protein n=1 Tax=Streptomyces sp. SAJ15 TaxID=2011095 RepID=UPI0021B3795B|nr:small secreted protein [Streptomyces sp. SAJ15]